MLNLKIEDRPNRLFEIAKERGRQIRDGKVRSDRVIPDLMKMGTDAGMTEEVARQIITTGIADGQNESRDS